RIAEAAQGSGELRSTLEQYNIAVRDASGRTRATVAILGDLADAAQNAESQQERLRIAFKAFDSEGAQLVALLEQGREGIERLAEAANAAGLVMTRDLINVADRAGDALGALEFATRTGFNVGIVRSF